MSKPEHIKTPYGAFWMYAGVRQNSEEWERLRIGRVTASEFSKIVTPAKCQLSAQATEYMDRLTIDTVETDVKGQPPVFPSYWMTRGKELEPYAREVFAKETGLRPVEVGFCVRADEWEILGCSPDSLIMDDVTLDWEDGLEIKCLKPEHHAAIVRTQKIPDDFKPQIHGSLVVTGLKRWWFCSACPGTKPFIKCVERDSYTEKMKAALDDFLVKYGVHRAELLSLLRLDKPEPPQDITHG